MSQVTSPARPSAKVLLQMCVQKTAHKLSALEPR